MWHVLIVDDVAANRDLIAASLRTERYRLSFAPSGRLALEGIREDPPDVVLMDVMMPDIDGITACHTLKQDPTTRLVPVILVTALHDIDSRLRGINAGADDFLSKPVNVHELRARVRSLVRLKRYTDDLDSAEAAMVSLAQIVEARDPYTQGHCERLAEYATTLGRVLGMDDETLHVLKRGAYLHDLGKIGVPDAVLLKPGKLTTAEYEAMKQHTVIGDSLCAQLRLLRRVRPIVRHHHERLDGSGYPDGLRGDAIPVLAQIIAIVDVFDALRTERPYKPAVTENQAFDELMKEVLRGWHNPDLVRTFIRTVTALD